MDLLILFIFLFVFRFCCFSIRGVVWLYEKRDRRNNTKFCCVPFVCSVYFDCVSARSNERESVERKTYGQEEYEEKRQRYMCLSVFNVCRWMEKKNKIKRRFVDIYRPSPHAANCTPWIWYLLRQTVVNFRMQLQSNEMSLALDFKLKWNESCQRCNALIAGVIRLQRATCQSKYNSCLSHLHWFAVIISST